jgi:hypothetical protein
MSGSRIAVVLALVLGVAAAVVVTTLPGRAGGAGARSVAPLAVTPAAGRDRDPDPVRTLAGWDRRRAAAWRLGSTRRLADLYVAGSAAGTRDVTSLRGYLRRGYRVSGMRMQLLRVAVLARAPDRWRLAVTDRLVGATVLRDGRRTALPRDSATRHLVTLMRGGDGRWRVATVADP